MSNASTGLWSAFGALVGGFAGATAGFYASQVRPRARGGSSVVRRGGYAEQVGGSETEDAMVIGGATGAVMGAFVAGAIAGGDPEKPKPQLPVVFP